MDRRTFLNYSLATGVVVWVGAEIPKLLGMSESEVGQLFAVKPANAATEFPQSVASGDPQTHGITLWTRVVLGQAGKVRVAFEVAKDSEFSAIALRGVAETEESKDYTLKVQLSKGQRFNPTPLTITDSFIGEQRVKQGASRPYQLPMQTSPRFALAISTAKTTPTGTTMPIDSWLQKI